MHQHSIDRNKWPKMELLKLWQGIYLLLNKEPDELDLRKKRGSYGNYGDVHFWSKFKEIKDMAEASIKRYTLDVYIYDSDFLYCELTPKTFFLWAESKGFIVPESLAEVIREKHPLNQDKTDNKYVESGKLSGQSRAEKGDEHWKAIKPKLIEIAKEHKLLTNAHNIAKIALKRNIITEKQLSNTAKKIRDDVDFFSFIKKKK